MMKPTRKDNAIRTYKYHYGEVAPRHHPGARLERKNGKLMLRLADDYKKTKKGLRITHTWLAGGFNPKLYRTA